jgi:hypothetical protein
LGKERRPRLRGVIWRQFFLFPEKQIGFCFLTVWKIELLRFLGKREE